MKTTTYRVPCSKLTSPLRIAVAADLHDNPHDRVLELLAQEKPDLILVPGDLTDDIAIRTGAPLALHFLREAAKIAPCFYSPGNHEIRCYHKGNPFAHPIPVAIPAAFHASVKEAGAQLLDNTSIHLNGLTICGLSSGICGEQNQPNAEALQAFEAAKGDVKILLCHHPEYYMPYLRHLNMDLIVCGHAHGGHWRFFGRGVYAPGQGLFPRYTSGVIDSKCVISRGLGNHTKIPRIANRPELVMIEFGG